MAKEQNLSLSPTKISGLCGRLMCCLNYEQEHYHDMCKKLPRVGRTVKTPDGSGEVAETNALTGKVKVKLPLEDGTFELVVYDHSQVRTIGDGPKKSRQKRRKRKRCGDGNKIFRCQIKLLLFYGWMGRIEMY